MQNIVSNVSNIKFDIELALEQQLGSIPLPFPGMDKSGSAICVFFKQGDCLKGGSCPFRHVRGDRSVVCKHWLRGLCKKGDQCEFLHEYDMTKMPECFFFSKFGLCSNKECPFLHIDPESKIKDCAWYDRGFCKHGPHCRNRHTRRVICVNYLCGFCPDGKNCKFQHPKFDLPVVNDPVSAQKKASITCHSCGEPGHKAAMCPKFPVTATEQHIQVMGMSDLTERPQIPKGPPRPLESVTCFKCGEKGHYANRCPKGHLAFLSPALSHVDAQKQNQM
ncbi:cleavage and polyadenylation specificity factor subunit 4-like [Saccoglossus kowalevskii]|uniref:Cleavage and polyadenylation specificity factor subunit 4 n=1 Tax=Saccoglossus kowalevskii TaxID=10224 RepID=A0ABM0GPR9_SACKO|nr:PREDICTED: cleavage and polyadenylation specificity factor subunit 4-like [Saccoglossus kowalevskii]